MSSLSVTTIQTKLHWENKRANLDSFGEKIVGLRGKTELVVLPEMFSTGFSMRPQVLAESMEGDTVTWMKTLSARTNLVLIGSLIIEEKGRYYNRLLSVLPNGIVGQYDKRHLFSYAGEDKHFTAGTSRLISSVKGWLLHLQVCYDLRFPVWARQQAHTESSPEYDVLIYVANWPEKRNLAWKTLLAARAIENQCFVIGVNRIGEDGHGISHSGDSMVLGPLGEILHQAGNAEEIHTTLLDKEQLQASRDRFPFWKDGDSFSLR